MIPKQCKILMWSCRGAGSRAFICCCKIYLRESKSDIHVIVETIVDPEKLRKIFKQLGFYGYAFYEVRGYFGGIGLAWKTGKLGITIMHTHFQFFHSKVGMQDGRDWSFTMVYASSWKEGKRVL